jgi:hypothetical protein
MPHRNALTLDTDHNSAIRAEIGERLRVLLSKEQPRPPPRVQHLLDRLNALDATGQPPSTRLMARESRPHGRVGKEALVAVSLCTGMLIACFSIALALL